MGILINNQNLRISYSRIFITVLDEMPQLHELQRLCRDDDTVNVIKAVAPFWKKFALYLTMDGNMVEIWETNHVCQVEDAAMKLFGHWLKGNGRQPISWKTLIQALHENDLSIIAIKVEEILTGHSGEISYVWIKQTPTRFIMLIVYSMLFHMRVLAPGACMH